MMDAPLSPPAAEGFLERRDQGDLWVFGYGSLMWRPGFEFTSSGKRALVAGLAP